MFQSRSKFRHFGQDFGDKPYFKATSSGNLADLVLWRFCRTLTNMDNIELAGPGITDDRGACHEGTTLQ